MQHEITASNPRPSTTVETDGAMDIDVTLTVDGVTTEGEVTLCPAQYDGSLASWGDPEHWVSGALLAAVRRIGDDAAERTLLDEIEAAAIEAAS